MGFALFKNTRLIMKKILFTCLMIFSLTAWGQAGKQEMQLAAAAYQKGDAKTAFKHLQNAANAGDAEGAYNLSVAYGNGDGVKASEKEALKWLKVAADRNHLPAQYELAVYYLSNRQAKNAAPILKKLADQGDAASQLNYGLMLINGDGVKKAPKQGKSYIQKAANQGFPPAQEVLQRLQ